MYSPVPSDPQPLLSLNCLVLGEQRSHIFPIKIDWTESVGWLRKSIKEDKSHLFKHVDARDLVLWRFFKAVDGNLERNLEESNFHEQDQLSPVEKLSKVFPALPDESHLHIVVGRPDGGKLR